MKKKVLVVVAHPDDETIWMGGTLLKNTPNWDLTIISLCRKYDKDRAQKFKKVCRILNAKCFMSDLEDEQLNRIPLNDVIKRIRKYSNKNYDYIFTHGENGEYGHKRHIDGNKAVVEMLKKKRLSGKRVFFFSYTKTKGLCYPSRHSDKFINLNPLLLKKKKEIIQIVYGFKKNSFEEICCRNVESFNVKPINGRQDL